MSTHPRNSLPAHADSSKNHRMPPGVQRLCWPVHVQGTLQTCSNINPGFEIKLHEDADIEVMHPFCWSCMHASVSSAFAAGQHALPHTLCPLLLCQPTQKICAWGPCTPAWPRCRSLCHLCGSHDTQQRPCMVAGNNPARGPRPVAALGPAEAGGARRSLALRGAVRERRLVRAAACHAVP